jgi:hypothetical protein
MGARGKKGIEHHFENSDEMRTLLAFDSGSPKMHSVD